MASDGRTPGRLDGSVLGLIEGADLVIYDCNPETLGNPFPGKAAAPLHALPTDKARYEEICATWHGEYGDRRQEIVLIGVDMDERALRAGFDAALLSDEEMAQGPDGWRGLPDPIGP